VDGVIRPAAIALIRVLWGLAQGNRKYPLAFLRHLSASVMK